MTDARYEQLHERISNLTLSTIKELKQDIAEYLFGLVWKDQTVTVAKGDSATDEAVLSKARPIKSQRSVRRLLTRFDFDRLVEIATPAELMQDLNDRLVEIKKSAGEDAESARSLHELLSELRKRLSDINGTREYPEIGHDMDALVRVDKQATALRRRAGSEGTLESLVQRLRLPQRAVAREWATLFRRLRAPTIHALMASVVAGGLYWMITLFVPSVVFAALPIFLPAVVFAVVYIYKEWRIKDSLLAAKRPLGPLELDSPDPHSGPSFWEADDPEKALEEVVSQMRRQVPDHGPVSSLLSFVAFLGLPLFVVAMLFGVSQLYLRIAPEHEVVIRGGSQIDCIMESGRVLWPGPFDIILVNGSGPVVIRHAERLYIRRGDGSKPLPRCEAVQDSVQQPSAQAARLRIIATFQEQKRINSIPEEQRIKGKGYNSKLSAGSMEETKLLGQWIKDCDADVEVKGFASRMPFSEKNQNYYLAEERRRVVLRSLDRPVVGSGFGSEEEMLRSNPFKALRQSSADPTEQMARISVIEIKNFEKCRAK